VSEEEGSAGRDERCSTRGRRLVYDRGSPLSGERGVYVFLPLP